MIKNYKKFHKLERELLKKEKLTISQKFKLFDEMYKYAVKMGAFKKKYVNDGLEHKIRTVQMLHGVYKGDKPIKKSLKQCLKKF